MLPRLATLLFSLLLLPSSALAQDLLCAWQNEADDGDDGRTPALRWFSGQYTLETVNTDEACQETSNPDESPNCANQTAMMMGLNSISVPRQAAYPGSFFGGLFGEGWRSTNLGNRIRNSPERGAMSLQWSAPGSAGQRMHGDMNSDLTHVWCVNREPGRMLLQVSAARDLRWGPAGLLSAIGDLIGIGDNKEYFGPVPSGADRDKSYTIPYALNPGWGFPTAEWRAQGMNQARTYDERFRSTHNPRYATNFTTWELQLQGRIYRVPTRYQTCEKYTWSWPFNFDCVKWRWVNTFMFMRELGGEARMTSFMSHRVGDDGYEPPRFTYQLRVRFSGAPIFEQDSARMERLADELERFCGSRDSCGSIPHTAAAGGNPPFGFFLGTDSTALLNELCETAGRDNYRAWGLSAPPTDCLTGENSLVPNSEPDAADVARDVTERGNTGRAVTSTEKTAARTGRRVVNGDTLSVGSQADRVCLRRAQRDSAEIVNGPFPVGESAPPPVPVDVLFNICAARTGILPRPNAPTPTLDANRCFVWNGTSYCIR